MMVNQVQPTTQSTVQGQDQNTYKKPPRGAVSGMSRCHFFG